MMNCSILLKRALQKVGEFLTFVTILLPSLTLPQ